MSVGTPMKAHHPMVARSVSCLTNHPSGKIDGSEVLVREPETGCSVIYVRVVHDLSRQIRNIMPLCQITFYTKVLIWCIITLKSLFVNLYADFS